jgi:hypothetical protein
VLCERLLEETGVAMLPGSDFGLEPSSFTVRLAYVDFDGGCALDAVGTVQPGADLGEAFLAENCPRVVRAIERVCEWLG